MPVLLEDEQLSYKYSSINSSIRFSCDTSYWSVLPGALNQTIDYGDWTISAEDMSKRLVSIYSYSSRKAYKLTILNRFSQARYDVWFDSCRLCRERLPALCVPNNSNEYTVQSAWRVKLLATHVPPHPVISKEVWFNLLDTIEEVKKKECAQRRKEMDKARKQKLDKELAANGQSLEEYRKEKLEAREEKRQTVSNTKEAKYVEKLAEVVQVMRKLDSHVMRFKQIVEASNENEKIVLPPSLIGFKNKICLAELAISRILPVDPDKAKKKRK